MNGPPFVAMMLSSLLIGCSTTYTIVEPSGYNPYTESQLITPIAGEELTVELVDGRELDAIQFRMSGDSCVWVDPKTGFSLHVRARDIKKVVAKNQLLGGLEGFGIGLSAGSLAGALLGKAIEGQSGKDSYGPALTGLGVAIVGTAFGAVYGAMSGHTYEYTFVWFTRKPISATP